MRKMWTGATTPRSTIRRAPLRRCCRTVAPVLRRQGTDRHCRRETAACWPSIPPARGRPICWSGRPRGIALYRQRHQPRWPIPGLADLKERDPRRAGRFRQRRPDGSVRPDRSGAAALPEYRRQVHQVRRRDLPQRRFERAVWIDYDHDYDLDLVLLGENSVRSCAIRAQPGFATAPPISRS